MTSLGSPIASGRTAEIYAWKNDCILKLIRPGFPAGLADQEWMHALYAWKLGASAPRPVQLLEVEGRRGVVFHRIDGLSLARVMQLAPLRIAQYGRMMGSLHARLHTLSAPQLPSQSERLRHNVQSSALLPEELKPGVLALLEGLPDGETLCHADFHPENILLTPEGPQIIDWESSLRGHPGGDVASTCLVLQVALLSVRGLNGWLVRQFGQRFLRAYLDEYRRLAPANLERLDGWIAVEAASRLEEHRREDWDAMLDLVRKGLGGSLT